MKTFVSLLFATICLSLQAAVDTNCPTCAYCSANYRAAGGAIAVITVHTNLSTGESIVLPVGVKMCDEVTNNPLWYVTFDFGPTVRILPRVNVNVSPGYIYYGPDVDGQPHYTYSSRYPIYIESTTNLCSPPCDSWNTNEYYLCLYSGRSQDGQAGPCQVLNTDNHMGSVQGKLYSGTNTNGLDMLTTYGPNITNSLMGRFGIGACDNRYDDANSRSSIAFLYFNLPPRVPTGYYCQNGTNFFQYPYQNGACGYTPDYAPGFGFGLNENNCQNWTNYPAPCDTNIYSEKLFRARCPGNPNCQP